MERRGGGGGNVVASLPSNTPRSVDKTAREVRTDANVNGKHDREKGVNVQVIVRCRPMNDEEVKLHTPVVITCTESKREVSAVQTIANKQIDRSFVFDKEVKRRPLVSVPFRPATEFQFDIQNFRYFSMVDAYISYGELDDGLGYHL